MFIVPPTVRWNLRHWNQVIGYNAQSRPVHTKHDNDKDNDKDIVLKIVIDFKD